MQFLGKYGEYLTMASLLENDIEAYPAIKHNQDCYDITAIVPSGDVARIQVKTRSLVNGSTNGTVGAVRLGHDFLIIVLVDRIDVDIAHTAFYVLTYQEALEAQAGKKELSVKRKRGDGAYEVLPEVQRHEGQWEKIRSYHRPVTG